MLAPPNKTFIIPPGGTLRVGQAAPAPAPGSVPTWAAAAPLNAWMEIPNTSGAGGTSIESFSGWANLPNGKIAIALAGGHTDGNKNSVAVIDLLANAPAWVEVCPESPTHTNEVAYEADGKPTSCHTYYGTIYVPQKSRLMRFGAYGVSVGGNTHFPTVDGFNLATNTWDPAGTYPNISPPGFYGSAINPNTGQVLLTYGTYMYQPLTGVTSAVTVGSVVQPRAPWAWDTNRNQFFGLCYGDNQEASVFLGIVAAVVVGSTMQQITIASSAAATQFAADTPFYAALEYDPVHDWFLFYTGSREGTAGRVYKVTPNNTTTWNMTIFSYGSGGITPTQTHASGIMNKFTYVPELGGIVMMATKAANLYFMRTTTLEPSTAWEGDWIALGDSLTDILYDIEASRWGFARTLVPPRVVWNAGIQTQGVAQIGARLQALCDQYPNVPNFVVRAGTNGNGTDAANYTAMMNVAAANNRRIGFLQVPPKGTGATSVSPFVAQNTWLAAQCAANPSYLHYLQDSDALAADGFYNANPAYTAPGDYIHQNRLGVYLQGEAQRSGLLSILPATSPLITDGADIYPANSASNQWVQNPLMLGGSASTFPTGWAWEAFGPSVSFTQSAFVDPDGTRWLRMTVTGSTAGYGVLKTQLLHPAINADMATIKRYDCIIEMRRTNVDAARANNVAMRLWTSGNQFASASSAIAPTPASGIFSDRAVLRVSSQRDQDNSAVTKTPAAQAANSLKMTIRIDFTGAAGAGGNIGIFDFRCASVRGSTT